MIVQHNITSMNANRQLGIVGSNLAKSTEKLSSGYKINRAADDAAGLAISEKMRAQVRGLNRASANAEDGISLIQTAEGAMDQQHAILQRTRELLVQASNSGVLDGTSENDFQKIQDEITTLKDEYERINTDTEFNKKKLLDSSYKDQYLQVGANAGQGIKVTINETKWDESLWLTKESTASVSSASGSVIVDKSGKATKYGSVFTLEEGVEATNGNGSIVTGSDYDELNKLATDTTKSLGNLTFAEQRVMKKYGYSVDKTGLENVKTDFVKTKTDSVAAVTNVSGDGISKLSNNVDTMIKSVTTERSKLGAIQNRLEYTVKVDDNTAENMQSAESRIRDTDMADEMTRFSKESILQQAATSMLAQANNANQGVLSLLQ